MAIDGVLLLGFGGVTTGCCGRRPACPQTPGCEVECFVSKVLGDDPRLMDRVQEVCEHYAHFGNVSPYNERTFEQAAALECELEKRGQKIPVRCGFRNWPPWYTDGLRELYEAGCRNIAYLVLAPHQCSRSWDDYINEANAARDELGPAAPACAGVTEPFFVHPGFISASAARIRESVADWDEERFAAAKLVLTAHAIPVPAERASPYRQQVIETAKQVAEACGHPEHVVAFQSAPDNSRIPWSEPRIENVLDEVHAAGANDVVVQSVGFIVDHIEVLFDIDTEARAQAKELGMGFVWAPCVGDHPDFIGTMAERVLELT